jgi:hypothetical protein
MNLDNIIMLYHVYVQQPLFNFFHKGKPFKIHLQIYLQLFIHKKLNCHFLNHKHQILSSTNI